MTVSELIDYLSKCPPEYQVMLMDSFNGGGQPREINLKTKRVITQDNADDSADCEELVGQTVVILGYGCY